MKNSQIQGSLRKFKKAMESLDLDKRIAATKWLEGVIVAQSLTTEERDYAVKSANEYIGDIAEEEYAVAVNALMEYFTEIQRRARNVRKKKNHQSV